MTSPRLVSANRNPALPDGVPRYAHLFGAQSERRLASCTGPFSPQPLPTTDPFLYGDSCLCPGRHPSRGLCGVTGPSRRLLAHFDIPTRSQMDTLCVAGKGRVFQFWALPFGLSLAPWVFTSHQGASRQVEGRASPRVFGRLADPGGFTGPVSYPRPSASTAGRSSGVRHQRCQVGGYPISDVLLSRYKFQYEGASGPVSRFGLAVRR